VKPDFTASLRRVRGELEEICEMLLGPSPEVLNACQSLMATVAAEMESTRPDWRRASGDTQAAEEARRVRRTWIRARRLLENAARFHAGWRDRRAAMSSEYRADGSLPELRCPARIFVEG
jgi:hypothetical protein